jgi:3alpha(or 20beta)-hydroxysteroid dehydrogenase
MSGSTKKLDGKVAIISGAARGQGADEARRFVAEGAKVVLTDILPGGADVAKELGDAAMFIRHDVTVESEWNDVVQATVKRFGCVNVLVNNAGVFRPASILDTTAESYDQHYRINQLGVFFGTKAVIGAMQAAGGGSIVNISSAAGMRGYPDMIAYAGTKWAVRGMTKCAARELAHLRIRVNSVHPGLVNTPMLADHDPAALKAFEEAVPLGRMAQTSDVVEIVVYLASDLSSNMTGSEIVTDGGLGL